MDYGLWQKSIVPNATDFGEGVQGVMQCLYTYFLMPAGFLRCQEHMPGSGMIQKTQSWYVPIDDTNTARYQVAISGAVDVWSSYDEQFVDATASYSMNFQLAAAGTGISVPEPSATLLLLLGLAALTATRRRRNS